MSAGARASVSSVVHAASRPRAFERIYAGVVQLVHALFPGHQRLADALDQSERTAASQRPPVVLVYGLGCSHVTWDTWRRSLDEDGFRVHVVDLPGNGMRCAREAAASLAEQIASVRTEHGCDLVQVVGFSFGGVVSRTMLQLTHGWTHVEQLLTVASPHHGSRIAPSTTRRGRIRVPRFLGEAARQLATDSPLINELASRWSPTDASRTTSIFAPAFDGFVAPWSSPELPGATNVVLRARTRFGVSWRTNHHTIVTRDPDAYETARRVLLGRDSASS